MHNIAHHYFTGARKDAWSKLKNIPKEEVVNTAEAKKSVFKIGRKTTPSQEEPEAIKKAEKADFEYRMYNEPNYTALLQGAVQKAKANHLKYCQTLITQKVK